jgi:hypothetical protein
MIVAPTPDGTQWFVNGNLQVTNQGNADAGSFVIKFYYIPYSSSHGKNTMRKEVNVEM